MPGRVYRVGLGRGDLKVTIDGVQVRPTLALGSYLAFQRMGPEAMVMGDLVLLHEEVNPVMRTGRLFFMHFWANDDAQKLAKGLRAALGQVKLANK